MRVVNVVVVVVRCVRLGLVVAVLGRHLLVKLEIAVAVAVRVDVVIVIVLTVTPTVVTPVVVVIGCVVVIVAITVAAMDRPVATTMHVTESTDSTMEGNVVRLALICTPRYRRMRQPCVMCCAPPWPPCESSLRHIRWHHRGRLPCPLPLLPRRIS